MDARQKKNEQKPEEIYNIMSQEKVERNKKIYKDRQKGMTLRALEDKYEISRSVIAEIIQRLKIVDSNKEGI